MISGSAVPSAGLEEVTGKNSNSQTMRDLNVCLNCLKYFVVIRRSHGHALNEYMA